MAGGFVNTIHLMACAVLCLAVSCPLADAKGPACEERMPPKIMPSTEEFAAKIREKIGAGEILTESALSACAGKIKNCVSELSPLVREDFEIIRHVGDGLQTTAEVQKKVVGSMAKSAMSKIEQGGDLTTCDRDSVAARTAGAVAILSAATEAEKDMEALSAERINEKKRSLKEIIVASSLSCRALQDFNRQSGLEADVESYKSSLVEIAARMEASYDVCTKFLSEAKRGKKSGRLEQRLYAAMRAHSDLPKWGLYESWPGCECAPGLRDSRRIAGVCFRGVTPFDPIDERMPRLLGRYAENLQKRAAAKGLRLTAIQMGGCSVARFSRLKNGGTDFVRQDLSPHAEARACDLYGATFQDLKSNKEKTVYFLDKDVRDGRKKGEKHPFAKAMAAYLDSLERDQVLSLMRHLVNAKNRAPGASAKNDGGPSIPPGIYDFRAISSDLEKKPCPLSAAAQCEQLELGAELVSAAKEVGFLTIAPGTDKTHDGHIHLSLATKAKDWGKLTNPGTTQECRDRIIDYYVLKAFTADAPHPVCE